MINKIINNSLLQALLKIVSLYAFAVTNLSNKNEIVNFKKSIDEHIKKEKTNIKVYYVREKSLLNCVIEK